MPRSKNRHRKHSRQKTPQTPSLPIQRPAASVRPAARAQLSLSVYQHVPISVLAARLGMVILT